MCDSARDRGSPPGAADGAVPGCPATFNFQLANPFRQNNVLLRGSPAVALRLPGASSDPRVTYPSAALAPLLPAVWYGAFQPHIPYSHEGLNAHRILSEAAGNIPAADFSGDAESVEAFRKRSWKLFMDMRGDQKWYSLRFGAWLVTHVVQWLFNGELYVNIAQAAELRDLAPSSTFVFVPTHKSHLDYHIMSYVLFSEGLACPHIAAGDNLRLPVIGSIMRTCGAFFIRRTSKGSRDAPLYKAVLDRYVRTLVEHGIPTEFFIEGGRSRDGRIMLPKLGLLSSCVDAGLSEDSTRAVHLVPVGITYDLPLEEHGLLLELMGAPKAAETILQFLCAFGRLMLRVLVWTLLGWARRPLGTGGSNGRLTVALGKPISVAAVAEEHARQNAKQGGGSAVAADGGAGSARDTAALARALPMGSEGRRNLVAELGAQVHRGMLDVNVVPSSALLAAALLPAGHVGEMDTPDGKGKADGRGAHRSLQSGKEPPAALRTLVRRFRWLEHVLEVRGARCMSLARPPAPPCGKRVAIASDEAHVLGIAAACGHYVRVDDDVPALRPEMLAALWQHTRLNYFLPALSPVGLVACALWVVPGAALGAGGSDGGGLPGAAMQADVVAEALWLRQLLAPDLNDALGLQGFNSRDAVVAELELLREQGVLARSSAARGKNGGFDAGPLGTYESVKWEPGELYLARFCVAALAPLLATYAVVAKVASGVLLRETMSGGAFVGHALGVLQRGDACAGHAEAPIPSKLLVQHALNAFVSAGWLQYVSSTDPRPGNAAMCHVPSNLSAVSDSVDIPTPTPRPAGKPRNVGGLVAGSDDVVTIAPGASQDLLECVRKLMDGCKWLAPLQFDVNDVARNA